MPPTDDCQLWPCEQAALRPPETLSVSDWCNANIRLMPEYSREPGLYRWQRTPYARDILDLYARPTIHQIVLKWATQLGKTQNLYNILAYSIHQDPFTTLLVYPTDDQGREVSRTRIQPMIEACPALKAKKPADPRQYQLTEMAFPGMVLHIAGSNSPTPLSQKPCRNIFRDEVNKWPPTIKDHGDPMDLSEERFKSFFDIRKVVDVSSPTTESGNITKQEARCQVVLKYFVPCPHCRRLQTLEWAQIKFDDDKTLGKIQRIHHAKKTAVYECRFCSEHIDDSYKDWLLSPENGAGWFDMSIAEPERSDEPIQDLFDAFRDEGMELESVAARLSSLYSPWLRWGDIAGKFLEAHLSDFKRYDKLRAFTNDWLGEEWKDVVEEKSESDILKLRCEYPPLVVPAAAIALTAGIDCQKSGFYFVVRAWARDSTSWLIRYGFLLTWADITRLVYEDTYEIEGGEERAKIWRAAVDTGGGEGEGDRSMTEEAYRWIAQYGRNTAVGVKGSAREMIGKMKLTTIGNLPGRPNALIPGGVRLWIVDTAYFKDVFHARMQIKAGDPGACYLHAETAEDYARQITAEEKRRGKDGRYVWQHVRGQNHYLDAEVYAAAMVDPVCYGGLGVLRDPKAPPRPRASRKQPQPERIPLW
ncbi:MAG: terminase gpA endonuclease subunit [Desulfobacterales bacterium]